MRLLEFSRKALALLISSVPARSRDAPCDPHDECDQHAQSDQSKEKFTKSEAKEHKGSLSNCGGLRE